MNDMVMLRFSVSEIFRLLCSKVEGRVSEK